MTDHSARRRDKEKTRSVDDNTVDVKHDKPPPQTWRIKFFVFFVIVGLLLILTTTVKFDSGQSHELLDLQKAPAEALPLQLHPKSQDTPELKRQQPSAQGDREQESLSNPPPQSQHTGDAQSSKSTKQHHPDTDDAIKSHPPLLSSASNKYPSLSAASSNVPGPRPAVAPRVQPDQRSESPPPPAKVPLSEDVVLSDGKPATSDVKGNLGPASVVTSPVVHDWLKDRWQAASDMSGTPIKGPHWVEVDLCSPAVVRSVKIDWEGAYATDYRIEGRLSPEDEWAVMVDATKTNLHQEQGTRPSKQGNKAHVYHHFQVPSEWPTTRTLQPKKPCAQSPETVRFLRLYIEKPAKKWGASVWHLQFSGRELAACADSTAAPCALNRA